MKVKFGRRKPSVARGKLVLNHERQLVRVRPSADLSRTFFQHERRTVYRAKDKPRSVRFLVEQRYRHRLGIFADLSRGLVMSPALGLGALRNDNGIHQFGVVERRQIRAGYELSGRQRARPLRTE